MIQTILEKPKKENFDNSKGVIIKSSKERLKTLLFEAIESTRFERVFNYRCGRCNIND